MHRCRSTLSATAISANSARFQLPRSRVRFLGSELLAPADAHAFLASPARYGPDWLVCPSWLKAGMPPMFTDASCGARCAHLKF